jgi:ATP-dependent 26S proteasome regulatory subunit
MMGNQLMSGVQAGNHRGESKQPTPSGAAMRAAGAGGSYSSSLEHILAELECLDILIEAQVRRARESRRQDDLQGLYISEVEIDQILAQPMGMPHWAAVPLASGAPEVSAALDGLRRGISERTLQSLWTQVPLRLATLAQQFELSNFEVFVILMCLASELDLRYERLYAYLQDDVTKKRPSVDLALNLGCETFLQKLEARKSFLPDAPLLVNQIVSVVEDPSSPRASFLSCALVLDDRIVNYLLEAKAMDQRIAQYVSLIDPCRPLEDLILPEGLEKRLKWLADGGTRDLGAFNFYFQGPPGVGKQSLAEALCHQRGWKMLVVEGAQLLHATSDFNSSVRLILREAMLEDAALYWKDFDQLLLGERLHALHHLLARLRDFKHAVFLAGEATWEIGDTPGPEILRIEVPKPCYSERLEIWHRALTPAAGIDAPALANRFRFTGAQIHNAAVTSLNVALQSHPESPAVTMDDLLEACRLQSNRRLAALATYIKPRYRLEDIVLPPDRLRQLRDVCNAVEHRSMVQDEWGFGARLSLGKGLSLLFAGPSGTGKTMAAEVLACELGLDLYKIDVSSVVSKYIGETEKNLARIFAEAETSNAILFFDEADALFGKRSEVRDSHDRYANIEISYLLQRIEECEGVVILATNFRKNMDDAFVRRIYSTIEFPQPGADDRLIIWRNVWPRNTPRGELDLEFMARRFELTGGNIRNIALASAFLGAEDGGCVRMEHLIRATWQEFQKTGKVVMEDEFGEYAYLAGKPY